MRLWPQIPELECLHVGKYKASNRTMLYVKRRLFDQMPLIINQSINSNNLTKTHI